MLRINAKPHPHQLIKRAKISYAFLISYVFLTFTCILQIFEVLGVSQKVRNVLVLYLLSGNPHFSILLHRVQYLKNLFMFQRTDHHFPG